MQATRRHLAALPLAGLLWCTALPAQTWTLVNTPSAPSARRFHTLSFDSARDRTVLFGGYDNVAILGDTWEYDGLNWQSTTPANSPPPRRYHAMCYDSGRGRTVLFGGADNAVVLLDTWEYDGVTWTQVPTANRPGLRTHPALGYDAARQRTVLFGGDGATGPLGDTWEYDGVDWTPASPIASPPPRSRTTLAYDQAQGRLVMFGGFDTLALSGNVLGLPLGDTWTYDGVTWASAAGGPPVRALHNVAYDPLSGRTLVFGGAGAIVQGGHGGGSTQFIYNDVWGFDGVAWTQSASPLVAPSGRFAAGFAFDTRRGCAVVHGGGTQTTLAGDTWEWRPAPAATWARYGTGCGGTAGVPWLAAAPGSTPGLGSTFTLQADNLPSLPGVTVLLLGFDLVRFGPGLLPFALDPQRPQCLLWLAPVNGAGQLRLHAGVAQASWAMPIPNQAALSGLVLGAQGFALDAATPSGFALSNGVILQLH